MSVFFYTPWPNDEWLKKIKKKFKGYKIYTLKNNPDYKKIKYALVWDLKDNILSKMVNLNAFFSLGAGADHILKLKNYINAKSEDEIITPKTIANKTLIESLYFF